MEPGLFDEIKLLRYDDTVLREADGTVKFQDVASGYRSSFGIFALVDSNMAELFAKRRWSQEEIPVLRGPPINSPQTLRYFPASQGHSAGQHVDLALQDLVLLPRNFIEYIYHVGNSHDLHSKLILN